jgi:hypothetical protein
MNLFKRIVLTGTLGVGLLGVAGCAVHSEGYYGEAGLPASYYYGPGYYDPSYPYYYRLHDGDRHDHDRHDGDRRGFAERRGEERAAPAGHMEHADGGHDGRDGDGGHGAATAGGHIGGDRR